MHEFRLAWRALRASPALTAAAVLSLALGMGANTAMFSVVDALLLRSLPVPDPHRLVTVSSGFALNHGFKAGAGMSYDSWSRMRERAALVGDGFAWSPGRVDLSPGGEAQPADALFTSGGFFSTLGVPPMLGRTFSAADDVEGGGRDGLVTVISYQLWQRRFGGAGTAIGSRAAGGWRALHGDWRHAAAVLRHRGRSAVRSRAAARDRAGDSRRPGVAASSVAVDVDRDVQAEAGTVHRRRHRRARGPHSAVRRRRAVMK